MAVPKMIVNSEEAINLNMYYNKHVVATQIKYGCSIKKNKFKI